MSKFTDQLWRDLVREHGPTLAHARRPGPGRARRPGPGRARRPGPRVLAGSTLALAGAGAAFTLALSATASPPAFAVTRHHDGSVSVQIYRRSGIAGANRTLAAMGIHERVMSVSDNQSVPLNCVAPGPGPDGKSLVVKGYPKVSTGPVSAPSSMPGHPGPGDTGPGDTGPGDTGAGSPGPGGTWHVVICPSPDNTGNAGSGNTGAG